MERECALWYFSSSFFFGYCYCFYVAVFLVYEFSTPQKKKKIVQKTYACLIKIDFKMCGYGRSYNIRRIHACTQYMYNNVFELLREI